MAGGYLIRDSSAEEFIELHVWRRIHKSLEKRAAVLQGLRVYFVWARPDNIQIGIEPIAAM